MASYDEPPTPESERIIREALERLGVNPVSTNQRIFEGVGAAAGAAADSMAANRSAGLQAAVDAERLNEARHGDVTAPAP